MGINRFICGGHNPESIHAVEHANTYYASIRKRTGDCETISNNTKFTLEQISLIKSYIFYAQHKLCNGIERFCPLLRHLNKSTGIEPVSTTINSCCATTALTFGVFIC